MTEAEKIFSQQRSLQKPFILYAHPEEDQLVCLWDDSVHKDTGSISFIFRGFDEKSKLLSIRGDHSIKLNRTRIPLKERSIDLDLEMDQGYAQMMQSAHTLLDETTCDKIVLSRVKNVDLPPNFNAVQIVMALQAEYPAALSYLLYHPHCGVWIGSTPETLVEQNQEEWKTMALAGTRPLGLHAQWSKKDIDEHNFVCEHIDKRLAQMGCRSIEKGNLETVPAGPVEHLRTAYRFQYSGEINKLVSILHPTPAICGTPKDLSYQKISELEEHERELYCGFIGPVSGNKSHLFVNLRCMKVENNQASLFVGGGITRDSEPFKEWKETEMKAQTLLKVMQNL